MGRICSVRRTAKVKFLIMHCLSQQSLRAIDKYFEGVFVIRKNMGLARLRYDPLEPVPVLAPGFDSRKTFVNRSSLLFVAWLLSAVLVCSCSSEVVESPQSVSTFQATSESDLVWPSADEMKRIGRQIWQNECGGATAGLTAWNEGEDFASLGIGHFIWYPKGPAGLFEESFPRLVGFLKAHPAAPALPDWVRSTPHCPWATRRDFLADLNGERLTELRTCLAATTTQQAEFLLWRLVEALPKMTAHLDATDARRVRDRFRLVLCSPKGAYAMIDYVNFKGEGVKLTERYRGEGWGLLQVLEQMQGQPAGPAVLDAFAGAAQRILRRRVTNSPPERNEQRWLQGWLNRCETYRSGRDE
jgi:hypothetical protein